MTYTREYKYLLFEKSDRVAKIIFNRPESRNALGMEMREDLREVLGLVREDPEIRALILTGAGKSFCAGGDIRTMKYPMPELAGRKRLKDFHIWLNTLINLEIPVIAAVNGVAAGAGCSLAMACDLIITTEESRFSVSFGKIGLIPDGGILYFLPRLVGLNRAKELMFTGRWVDASEALAIGLVNEVVPPEQLIPRAEELAGELARGAGKALALTKRLLNLSMSSDLETILEFEALGQDICFGTEDFVEGSKAFLEKRKPEFKQK
ncbi:MAG: enoyl-CoA hydratase/isomerase family protein [Desulfomonile tiedjei]|nr:enoyl-CoA hydratase/isomerase family protein [Desulfomonile tiedjei]